MTKPGEVVRNGMMEQGDASSFPGIATCVLCFLVLY
jgi:hypothetical protein